MEGQRVYALFFKPHGGPELQYGRDVFTDETATRAESEAWNRARALNKTQGKPRIYVGRLDKRSPERAEQIIRAKKREQGEAADHALAA